METAEAKRELLMAGLDMLGYEKKGYFAYVNAEIIILSSCIFECTRTNTWKCYRICANNIFSQIYLFIYICIHLFRDTGRDMEIWEKEVRERQTNKEK